MIKVKQLFLFFIFILLGSSMSGQNPFIRHYTTLDGLPSNTIYQIYQDSKRFIWFTTDAGVVRFDGSTFTNYRKEDGLSSNDVIKIKEDTYGRIWFSSINGTLNFFYNDEIFNYQNCGYLRLLRSKDFIVDFFQGKNDIIYFYNRFGEVFTLDSNQIIRKYSIGKLDENSPINWNSCLYMYIHHMNQMSTGEYVFWTSCGIFKLRELYDEREYIDISVGVWGVFPTTNSSLIINTTTHGLFLINSKNERQNLFRPCEYQYVKTIIVDSQGFMWFAAYDKGVYCVKDGKIIEHFDIDKALGLMQDNENNIWVSSMNNGIFVINRDVLVQKHIQPDSFKKNGVIKLAYSIDSSYIWLSSGKSIFSYRNNNLVDLNISEDQYTFDILNNYKRGSLLVGVRSNSLFLIEGLSYKPKSGCLSFEKKFKYIRNIKKVAISEAEKQFCIFDQAFIFVSDLNDPFEVKKKLYVGERINNIFYNSTDELVVNGMKNYKIEGYKKIYDPLLTKLDGSIILDHKIIEKENELYNVDGEKLYFRIKDKMYDLTASFVPSISGSLIKNIAYFDSCLYLSTLRNIYICGNPFDILKSSKISIRALNVNFEKINDLLPKDSVLYVASNYGLTMIPFEAIKYDTSVSPIPVIKAITINDKYLNIKESGIKLVGPNRIGISYGALSYSSKKIFYSYMLKGIDSSWHIGEGFYSNVVFQNLPKGHYVFKLRVRKANSDWSETLELPIIIKPTFYEYPAFWVLIFLILIFIGIQTFMQLKQMRLNRIENNHQLVMLEQKALLSMMNPHFIFNSLGSIQNFMLRNRSGEALIYLSQFSRLIRQNFNAVNVAVINLEDEIDRLKNYLELEQIRLENKFEYFIEIDGGFSEDVFFIPSMIIQPFAENAVWHGIASINYKGIIRIKFIYVTDDIIKVIIEDNGVGIQDNKNSKKKSLSHLHQGMKMTKRRLMLLGEKIKSKSVLEITPLSPNNKFPGTRIVIHLPFYNENTQNVTD